ncbi:phenylalanine--tRNA ligase subunit alpha [Candidatus Woesearchaeota archaeon]|nr:phenylalanine--tRNA ligase subunit alpha [Candidatus Woesearchaeota archaeon]
MSDKLKQLHPYERAVLPLVHNTSKSELVKTSGLKDVEVMRALEWLENKKLISSQKKNTFLVQLSPSGITYARDCLPERKLLSMLPAKFDDIKKNVSSEELNAALGVLRSLSAIEMKKTPKGLFIELKPQGHALNAKKTDEELFLQQQFPFEKDTLKETSQKTLNSLIKRGIVAIHEEKEIIVQRTSLGDALAKELSKNSHANILGRLTSQIITSGEWKKSEFRSYDVKVNVPPVWNGRKHMVTQAVEYIKRIWIELGFKEMSGRMIETAFWDLDALFVPQDHPARDMQDTFYVASPPGTLPPLAKKVKAVHETGADTGSKGWGKGWSEDEAKQLMLRTHTTVLSAQTIAKLKQSDLPAKFFAVGKVFRNEVLDWKHLFEFYQVEGIVVDPHANLQHLKGYLKEFYKKMGYPDVRIRPAHFPYTEPSCEVEVFHPVKKEWMELGGAGIFRPEVVIPLLGKDVPVLAWGLGLDRIISSRYALTDIRDLYNNDVKMLREAELWVK